MLKEVKVKSGIGFEFDFDMSSANFVLFEVGWHWHPHLPDYSTLQPNDVCKFRAGVYIGFCNIRFSVGHFWHSVEVDGKNIWAR